MEKFDGASAASESRSRKRKGRNSDARKEQNRIASRAYREKRKQKLALLDEILKSDCHTDSMSSVSDETECNSTTPAPEFRALDIASRSRHPTNSPTASYLPAASVMAPVTAGMQPLLSNGPSRDTETYVSYRMDGYSQGSDVLTTHAEYPPHSVVLTNNELGITSHYGHAIPPIGLMPSAPLFPFDEEFMDDCFGIYPLPEGGVSSLSESSGYDPNMINALQSLSKLNDNQQQQILALLQKRRNQSQPAATNHTFGPGFSGFQVPVSRSSPVSGMKVIAWSTQGLFTMLYFNLQLLTRD
ncbi:hypothetical protein F5Y19DRAFT_472946 [Xylariaceae sp. FL1651]|nr:hypothetical protein F5Y19DRAFT_472946 [Xylariaceae sp. FL1651]